MRILWALMLVAMPALADVTITEGPWTLYRGTSIVQPRVDYPSQAACAAAADALNELRDFTCRTITRVTVRADAPPPPHTPPPPPPPGDVPYNLGPLPPELSGLRWPERPRTTSNVTVRNLAELNAAPAGANVTVAAGTYTGGWRISRADQRFVWEPGAVLAGSVQIALTQERTAIVGLDQGGGEFEVAGARDLFIDQLCRSGAGGTLMQVSALPIQWGGRGSHRVAIINSTVKGGTNTVAMMTPGAATARDFNQDFIFANVNFEIGGGTTSALVRLQNLTRGVIVDSRLASDQHHSFRWHYSSDAMYLARNRLEGAGTQMGVNPGSVVEGQIGTIIWEGNTFYHTTNNLLLRNDVYPRMQGIRLLNNIAYTRSFGMFDQRITGPNDVAQGNVNAGPVPAVLPEFRGGATGCAL